MDEKKSTGMVYLVGAGPGAPDLITLRGISCLARADVVLYDFLANSRLLQHAPQAEKVCVGKHGGGRIWSQEEINAELVRLAGQGKKVVRLKGGDPAVFARGAEEAEALVQENIPFEIVPGITAALAAGSYAGIPVTHRERASAVALVTGQQKPDQQDPLNYSALAGFPGTLVMYMGVTTAPAWTSALISAGKPASTPAAIIRRCSLPDQQTIHCTLGEVAQRLERAGGLRPPVIVVLGEVVPLAQTLNWFEKRPLFGVRILVTRPEHQTAALCELLEEQGATLLVQPAIEIGPPADWSPVDEAISQLASFDWLVFSSTNGVNAFFERLFASGRDLRALGAIKLASVGPATARELTRYHLQNDLLPGVFDADALAAELCKAASGKRFLLMRASRGRDILAEKITAAGGSVTQVVVYTSADIATPDPAIAAELAAGKIDWITVTSSAIARSLINMFGADLRKSKLASISPITSGVLSEAGFPTSAEAEQATMPGVAAAIVHCVSQA